MEELGLAGRFLALPHQKVARITGQFGDTPLQLADFSHLPVRHRYIAMMPQWDFLNFLAGEGQKYPGFKLLMKTEATGLIEESGRVVGFTADAPDAAVRVTAPLVVGADGRASTLRAASGLAVLDIGAPMDALWFRMPRRPDDTAETQGRFLPGRLFVMLNRGDYWQCAYVIPKGSHDRLVDAGIDDFRRRVGEMVPFEAARAREIGSWDEVKLLNVKVDRLKCWARPGLLFIGDAAHAMSPVGGVGVNLAIQDAVAAANVLARPLAEDRVSMRDLAAVQRRRELPTKITQRMQVAVQNTVISRALEEKGTLKPPLALRIMAGVPWLRRIPARLVGMGVRPEHVCADILRRQGTA
jgi:2-polyprenyl-6-methoxyphenol hydroxylase-like FAD-dependent oxidoreductase